MKIPAGEVKTIGDLREKIFVSGSTKEGVPTEIDVNSTTGVVFVDVMVMGLMFVERGVKVMDMVTKEIEKVMGNNTMTVMIVIGIIPRTSLSSRNNLICRNEDM